MGKLVVFIHFLMILWFLLTHCKCFYGVQQEDSLPNSRICCLEWWYTLGMQNSLLYSMTTFSPCARAHHNSGHRRQFPSAALVGRSDG